MIDDLTSCCEGLCQWSVARGAQSLRARTLGASPGTSLNRPQSRAHLRGPWMWQTGAGGGCGLNATSLGAVAGEGQRLTLSYVVVILRSVINRFRCVL